MPNKIMFNNINDLLKHTGDSTLLEANYDLYNLDIRLELYMPSVVVNINIPTRIIRSNKPFSYFTKQTNISNLEETRDNKAHLGGIWTHEISSLLNTNEFGYYIPHQDFKILMQETNKGYSLAYGLKESESLILMKIGAIDCIVEDLSAITFEIIENYED